MGASIVLLPLTATELTPDMYGGGVSGFIRASEAAAKRKLAFRARGVYSELREWNVPSNLIAHVNSIPNARVTVRGRDFVLTFKKVKMLDVTTVLDSVIRIEEANRVTLGEKLTNVSLSITSSERVESAGLELFSSGVALPELRFGVDFWLFAMDGVLNISRLIATDFAQIFLIRTRVQNCQMYHSYTTFNKSSVCY